MKVKTFFAVLITILASSSFARVNYPAFRTLKPSVLVRPQSKYFSVLLNLEPRFVYFLTEPEDSTQRPRWIDLDLISSYEISPFPIKNMNIGLQTTLGSSGVIFHTVGKWILFPDYKLQPALGIFADLYGGFSPQKHPLLGSNIQVLIQKTFHTRQLYTESLGVYLAPLLRIDYQETNLYNLDWIAGFSFNFDRTQPFNTQWTLNFEGRYNISFFEVGLRFLMYIQ